MGSSFSKRLKHETPEERSVSPQDRKFGISSGSVQNESSGMDAGWVSMRGNRPRNEDACYCRFEAKPGGSSELVGLFGIFDGHGGPAASAFVREKLLHNLLNQATFPDDIFKAIGDAYLETDKEYIELEATAQNDDGSTAVTAVVAGNRLLVAHVGDSRAVLGIKGQAVALSSDHKPDRADERDRIEQAGGLVVYAGTWRVGGVLAVSRAFGNRQLKQYVTAVPEINETAVTDDVTCLVLASDGVWDVIMNQEAVRIVEQYKDAEEAARALVVAAYSRGSNDNISAVVCLFNQKRGEAAPAGGGGGGQAKPDGGG